MAPAVAPSGPVLRFLATAHTNLLMSVVAPPSDRFRGSLNNSASKRRCVRMVCQNLDFAPWPVILMKQFLSFWGHAARVTVPWSPITECFAFRNAGWRMLHPDGKQAKGIRLDTCQKLQDWWLQFRPPGSAIFYWCVAAQDRALWKDLTPWLLNQYGYPMSQWFQDLHEVDLHHRPLLLLTCLHTGRGWPIESTSDM